MKANMNSDTKFPATIPPFRYPVPPPDVDPDIGPLVQVCVNFDWMAYILGALKSLMLQATWATDDDSVRELALQRTELLLGMFMQARDGCGLLPPGILCISGSFEDLDYGFVPALGVVCDPTWVSGTGWESCYDATNDMDVAAITRAFDNATFIRNYTVHSDGTTGFSYTLTVTFFYLAVQVFQDQATFSGGGPGSLGGDVNQQVDFMLIEVNHSTIVHNADLVIKDWALCYTGDFPLAGQDTFTHTFDFTVDDGGWVERAANEATYNAGVGWTYDGLSDNIRCVIQRTVPGSTEIRSMTVTYDWTFGSGNIASAGHRIATFLASTLQTNVQITSQGTGQSQSLAQALTSDLLEVNLYACESVGCTAGTVLITQVVVSGVGVDPF